MYYYKITLSMYLKKIIFKLYKDIINKNINKLLN
jgi:hypothetical protein